MFKKTIKTFIILAGLFSANFVLAVNSADVVINEIAWMGTTKNWRYEWLELYNNTDNVISLDGWKIELYRTDLDWFLELNGSIPAQEYFLIVASDKIFPDYDLNYSNLGGKFINNGQMILLRDSAEKIIDDIDCSSGWFTGDNITKQTMERKNFKIPGTDPDNWQTSQNPGGTPKADNSIFTELKLSEDESWETSFQAKEPETTYPAGIFINEILPDPEGIPDTSGEYIEIFNENKERVDLSEWKIADTIGRSAKAYTFPENTIINGKGFLVFYRPTTKITLNNNNDRLYLIQPDGKMADSVAYEEKAPKGKSLNRTKHGWIWGPTLTPGSTNIIPVPQSPSEKGETSEARAPEAKKFQTKKQLAAAGESVEQIQGKQISKPTHQNIGRGSKSLFVFLIALAIAIFSGIIILILKKKLK